MAAAWVAAAWVAAAWVVAACDKAGQRIAHDYLFFFYCRQLLHDCGIGVSGEGGDGGEGVTSAVSQHRALIFCQYKSMLNIIQNDLFK